MDEKEKLNTLAVVPLYKQLKRLLEDALNDGTWKPGESLPSEPELAREYGVMSIPNVVILKDGKEVDRKVGVMPAGAYTQALDAALG